MQGAIPFTTDAPGIGLSIAKESIAAGTVPSLKNRTATPGEEQYILEQRQLEGALPVTEFEASDSGSMEARRDNMRPSPNFGAGGNRMRLRLERIASVCGIRFVVGQIVTQPAIIVTQPLGNKSFDLPSDL